MGYNDRKSEQAKREDRRKKVAANLLAGLSYRDIAEALNVSLGTVANDARIILGRWQREQIQDLDQYVLMELRRLDLATYAIWNDVQDGKLNAIDRMVRLMERRARLLGLDAPTRQELVGPDGAGVVIHLTGVDPYAGD